MSCNDITGISGSNCTKSMGGITNVWIFPFNNIGSYIYTADYLQKITGYSTNVVPVLYEPNAKSSDYKGTYNKSDYKAYSHELILAFSKMEASKREELIKLESMDLTIIFSDRNGLTWIMGQDFPVQLNIVNVGSGVKGGNSMYNLTFTSKEKNHIREIEAPSDTCFVSFEGIESRTSTIEVTTASLLTWEDFRITADEQILSYFSPSPLDPVNWATPATLLADLTQLAILINQYGTSVVPNVTLTGSYDIPTDTATIVITSPDTTYGAFEVDNTVFNTAVGISLNLTTVLSPLVANPTTTITVTDSVGTLYTGAYQSAVSGTGLTGLTNDSIIDISTLYPSGTVFTMTTNLGCSTVTYEYTFENTLGLCEILTSFDFSKGTPCSIDVPYVTGYAGCPKFQSMTINMFGNIYNLYSLHTEWHDVLATFEKDILNLFNQAPIDIDTNSVVFTDNTTYVTIEFNTVGLNATDAYFNVDVTGFNQPAVNVNQWKQSRVLNLNTAAPYPSIVSHTDEYTNVISGENLVDIQSNLTYGLSNTSFTSNTSIDNVGLIWGFDGTQPYNELSIITTAADAPECLTPSLNSSFDLCYTGYTSTSIATYQDITLDVTSGSIDLGKTFEMVTSVGTTKIVLGSDVTTKSNHHLLTQKLNAIAELRVLHMSFDPLLRTYTISLRINSGTTIVSFEETTTARSFTLVAAVSLFKNTLDTPVNPYVELDWTLPTTVASSATGSIDAMQGHWQDDTIATNAIEVIWDQAGDTITLTKGYTAASTLATEYVVSLHEAYPTNSNSFLTMTLIPATASYVEGSVAGTLITNGSSVGAINYVAYTNYLGWTYVEAIDLSIANDAVSFDESHIEPKIWGTNDSLEYIGTETLAAPTITSIACVDACAGIGIQSYPFSGNTTIVYTYTGTPWQYTGVLSSTTTTMIKTIARIEIVLTPQTTPAVTTNNMLLDTVGCVAGFQDWNSTSVFDFAGDPTGKSYDQQVTCYDILGNVITTFAHSTYIF